MPPSIQDTRQCWPLQEPHRQAATATRTCRTRAGVNRVVCLHAALPTWCTLRGEARECRDVRGGYSPPPSVPTGG